MKKIITPVAGLCFLAALLCSGCVSTTFEKSVTVERDADGKVLKIIEHEGIIQPGADSMPKMQFKHLEVPK
jgi:hypothetical protein